MLQAPLATAGPGPHARVLGGADGELWGAAAACCAWAFVGRRLGSHLAGCQVGAARDVGAAALLGIALSVDCEVLVVVLVTVAAAGSAAVAPPRGRVAGAGSPRNPASLWRRMFITPSRDAICR